MFLHSFKATKAHKMTDHPLEETLDPDDWDTVLAIAHKMIEDAGSYTRNVLATASTYAELYGASLDQPASAIAPAGRR